MFEHEEVPPSEQIAFPSPEGGALDNLFLPQRTPESQRQSGIPLLVHSSPGELPAAPRRRHKLLVLFGTLGILVILLVPSFLVLAHTLSWPPFSRQATSNHGLPSTIPLPEHGTFVRTDTEKAFVFDQIDTMWFWTFAAPTTTSSLLQFYQDQLPRHGWRLADGGYNQVIGCQNTAMVEVTSGILLAEFSMPHSSIVVQAPPGGVVLEIKLYSDATKVRPDACA